MKKEMKKWMTALLLTLACQQMAVAQTEIAVITDTHVLAPELLIKDGTAWKNDVNADRKLIDYSKEIFDELVKQFKTSKPDLLLMTGDLTKDGEKLSHEYVVRGLAELKEAGVKVYVIPGNHDIDNSNAKSYDGSNTTRVESINSNGFATLYADYGYNGTTRDVNSLSYACEPIEGLVLIGIDSHTGGVPNATLDWVCQQADKAWKEGKQVIAMMHHPLFPHILGASMLGSSFNVNNYETVRNRLADAGVRVILTGHVHTSDIAKDWNADLTKEIYDVNTGSVISYPCDYRIMTLSDNLQTLHVTTSSITTLPSKADFADHAKTRFHDSIKKIINEKVSEAIGSSLGGIVAALINTLLNTYIEDAVYAAIIHAEGNENAAVRKNEKATDYYLGIVDDITGNRLLSGTIQDLLSEQGLTVDDVKNIVHSLMDDKSNYGTERADKTDDRSLTITMPDLTEGMTLAGDGWSTYCSDRRLDLTLTEGITGYIVETVTDKTVGLKEVSVVPAETGFIINGDERATISLKATDKEADDVSSNLLTGLLTDMAAPANSYVLSTKNGATGFYPVKAGLSIPARRAYLTTTGGGARGLVMPTGETTGISESETTRTSGQSIYTLQGTKVDKARKGVFVSNGKLIIIK